MRLENILICMRLCIVLIFFSLTLPGAGYAADLIEVSAQLIDRPDKKVRIEFTLKNASNVPLRIVRDDLPWNHRNALTIVPVKNNGDLIKEIYSLIQIDSDDTILLGVNESIKGSVILSDRFPAFESARSKNEIIVFWSYRPGVSITMILGEQPRSGGWFSVKSKLGM